jgi:hypothetical protein
MDRRFWKDKVAAHYYPPRQFWFCLEFSVAFLSLSWVLVSDYPLRCEPDITHSLTNTFSPATTLHHRNQFTTKCEERFDKSRAFAVTSRAFPSSRTFLFFQSFLFTTP